MTFIFGFYLAKNKQFLLAADSKITFNYLNGCDPTKNYIHCKIEQKDNMIYSFAGNKTHSEKFIIAITNLGGIDRLFSNLNELKVKLNLNLQKCGNVKTKTNNLQYIFIKSLNEIYKFDIKYTSVRENIVCYLDIKQDRNNNSYYSIGSGCDCFKNNCDNLKNLNKLWLKIIHNYTNYRFNKINLKKQNSININLNLITEIFELFFFISEIKKDVGNPYYYPINFLFIDKNKYNIYFSIDKNNLIKKDQLKHKINFNNLKWWKNASKL